MNIKEKISALRDVMTVNNIAAVIIPSSDPHQSEYLADHWKDREWLSGFSGSAGTLVVGADFAGLWTDSRYFLQAETELAGTGIQMMKLKNQFNPEYAEYLRDNLAQYSKVAVDGWDISVNQFRSLKSLLSTKNIELITNLDVVSQVWSDRPTLPFSQAIDHDIKFCGETRNSKIARIRARLIETGSDAILLNALDDIAWTFNIRGKDVQCNPVLVSYAYIDQDNAILFVNEKKINDHFRQTLIEDHITIKPYDSIIAFLNESDEGTKIALDPAQCNYILYQAINGIKVETSSIPKVMKAIKNNTEVKNIKNAMIKDGVALAEAFYQLDLMIANGEITEAQFAQMLAVARSKQLHYEGESFDAIIGYNGNGAIIHYRPDENSSSTLKPDGILLADSGGQYLDGTTDITRTIALSNPSQTVKKHFTLVLKGLIALSKAVFPRGTKGGQLDLLARQFLWQEGLNYGHGTGHGVGFFLNVHEPPQGFAVLGTERGNTAIEPGMLTSNEPGFYLEGHYGIRIENLIMCNVHDENKDYLCFETVTLFPIDKNLIDYTMLTKLEVEWLNEYHETVFDRLHIHLDNEVCQWLKEKCSPV